MADRVDVEPDGDMDVEAFTRLEPDGEPDADAGAEDVAATASERDARGHAIGHGDDACPVAFCPIAMALSTASQLRPDAVEHLLAAGRELMLAAKSALDAAGDRGGSSLQRIRIG